MTLRIELNITGLCRCPKADLPCSSNAAEISAFIKVFEIKKGSNSVGNNRPPQTGFRAPVGQGVSGTGFEMTSPRKGNETTVL